MKRILSWIVFGVVLSASVLASGCFYSREIAQVRRDIERSAPGVDIERGISMNLGPFSLRMARWILRRVDDEDAAFASEYLTEVRRVKAGIYQRRNRSDDDVQTIPSLRRFERRGWELAVRASDEEETVLVYYRERRGTVSEMFAVVASRDEIVLAKIEGRLNRLLERAIADHDVFPELIGFNFDE